MRFIKLALKGLLCFSFANAAAQSAEVHHPATDTLQPKSGYYVPPVLLCTSKGKLHYGFMNDGTAELEGFYFTWRHPASLPRPKPVLIKYTQVRWVRRRGRELVPLHLPGRPFVGLVERRVAGPHLELFEQRSYEGGWLEVVPLVGAVSHIRAATKGITDSWYWYLRVPGPGDSTMTVLLPGKQFGPMLADFLRATPALADSVRRAELSGTRLYQDIPRLIARYNRLAGAAPAH
ncbi:hypothetical protein [Hymenobacter ruricola]|uniref:Uncharacterized protein n=1 Tax=Hymenobacter ruricola TaxID=2791023 RepID=A0ABS0I9S8_9BACT|nr:hypothetical protein [Hymenobacter ruricola]MBF9223719.1 hypothetical protein [Hymenobacter ruricola]